jgi:uncharacterized protein (DUF305 family)
MGPRGISIPKVIAACLVFAFAGFGIGTWMNRDDGPAHNAVDVGFLRDMMLHHEQAIEMSVVAVRRATSADVRQEALNILIGQRGEYVLMLDRLRAYGVDPEDPNGQAMGWMGMAMPADQMPGLATAAQMRALKDAQGTDLDIEFAKLMIVHHRAGAEMAQFALDNGRDIRAIGMASQMVTTQESEIAELRKFIRALGTEIPDPGPVMAGGMSGHNMSDMGSHGTA